MSCGHTIFWFDLVPVFSWIYLWGRCRHCGSKISIQYPLVEATTALTFALIGGIPALGPLHQFLFCAIASILIAIAVYDINHTIIPDTWAYFFAALSFLAISPHLFSGAGNAALYLFAGPITATPLFFLWLVSRGTWMGLGDSKLALGMGYLLGPYLGIVAVFLAFLIGAVVAVTILIPLSALRSSGRQITMKSEVPFGPFLVVSTLFMWLLTWYGVEFEILSWV